MKSLYVMMLIAVAGAISADTLIWKGTAGGGDGKTFASELNWWNEDNANQAPVTGDTLVFSSAATITSPVDLGAVGYTFQCGTDVKVQGVISGKGKLIKSGTKQLDVSEGINNTYSGGTVINNGMLFFNKGSTGRQVGTGPIEIHHASGVAPKMEWYSVQLTNDILVTGNAAGADFDFGLCQKAGLAGVLTATTDFTAKDRYNTYTTQESAISGTVNAHGHTMYLTGRSDYGYTRLNLSGTFDCSVYKMAGKDNVYTSGKFIDVDANYVFCGGTNYFTTGAYVGCTNIFFTNTIVNIRAGNPFSFNSTLRLRNSKIVGAEMAVVKEFIVDGVSYPRGIYTAKDLPDVIEGNSGVYVDCYNIWTGAEDLNWNTPGNWSLGRVPGSGDVAVFTNDVTIAEANRTEVADIGEEGLILQIDTANVYIYSNFSGPGQLVKRGTGVYRAMYPNSYTGGLRILSGEVWGYQAYSFGLGPIYVDRSSSQARLIPCNNHNDTNTVYVLGPYTSNEKTLQFGQTSGLGGDIIGTNATFCVHSRFSGPANFCKINGNVHNHGGLLLLSAEYNNGNCNLEINGKVDSNVRVIHNYMRAGSRMVFNGELVDEGATFEMLGATNIVSSGAYVACTNIIVNNQYDKAANLTLRGGDVINPAATLYITNNATVEVTGNYTVYLRDLVINGERKGKGAYSASNCPGVIFGTGRLRVGVVGMRIFLR